MKSTSPSPLEEGEERAAGFVLFRNASDSTREYLLLKHTHGGHWAFPKGHVEPGEDDQIAAIREVMEETGIAQIQPVPRFREISRYELVRGTKKLSKTVVYFLGSTEAACVELSLEHEAFRWLPAQEASLLLTYDQSRRILGCAEKALEQLALEEEQ